MAGLPDAPKVEAAAGCLQRSSVLIVEASDISNKIVHQNHNSKTEEKEVVKPVMEKVLVKVVEDMMVEKVSERVVKDGIR